jgi:hypothetical protein
MLNETDEDKNFLCSALSGAKLRFTAMAMLIITTVKSGMRIAIQSLSVCVRQPESEHAAWSSA